VGPAFNKNMGLTTPSRVLYFRDVPVMKLPFSYQFISSVPLVQTTFPDCSKYAARKAQWLLRMMETLGVGKRPRIEFEDFERFRLRSSFIGDKPWYQPITMLEHLREASIKRGAQVILF